MPGSPQVSSKCLHGIQCTCGGALQCHHKSLQNAFMAFSVHVVVPCSGVHHRRWLAHTGTAHALVGTHRQRSGIGRRMQAVHTGSAHALEWRALRRWLAHIGTAHAALPILQALTRSASTVCARPFGSPSSNQKCNHGSCQALKLSRLGLRCGPGPAVKPTLLPAQAAPLLPATGRTNGSPRTNGSLNATAPQAADTHALSTGACAPARAAFTSPTQAPSNAPTHARTRMHHMHL